jgi:transposase
MAINEIRQQARRSAAERVARLRQQRADLVKEREGLSAEVMTALAERDALIADAERRAGTALKALVSSGLSLSEPTVWCDLGDKDAARLVRLAAKTTSTSGESTASGAARAF